MAESFYDFDKKFRDKTVTISVQEMADIITRKMDEICNLDDLGDDPEIEDIALYAGIIAMLGKFGACIMQEMFIELDGLEIEPNDNGGK